MKKLLLVMIVVLLCGCGSKKIAYEDAKEKYLEVENEVTEAVSGNEEFLAGNFIDCFDAIKAALEELKTPVDAKNEETVITLYRNAATIGKVASLASSDESAKLGDFAARVKDLVKAAYDNSSELADLKAEIEMQAEEFYSWDAGQWAKVEKRKRISWAEVASEYEELAQQTLDELNDLRDVSELELEGLKDIILDNYESIANGVTAVNKESADEVYCASLALYEYTNTLNNIDADKVARFAMGANDYVKRCYGENIPDEYQFSESVKSAAKWSLSLWNELVTLMKKS